MRIVMVAARYLPFVGGIETHIHEVGARMAALGHRITVLTTDPAGDLPATEEVRGMQITRVRAWPRRRDYYFSPGIYRELLRGSWDIAHFQGYNTFVAPIGLLAAVRRELPFVLTFHSGGHSSRWRNSVRRLQHFLLRPLAARADRLIGVSQFETDFFSRRLRIDRGRFATVPNGAELPVPSEARARQNGRLIVSIGRLERYKGHHRVIKAFPELLRLVPDARLQIVGSGPYEPALRRLVRDLGLEQRVAIGAIPSAERQRLADLLGEAALVVLLSEYEAHPVAIMEALALRRPALVSDTTGLRELAERGLCRAIPLNAGPAAVAGAIAQELQGGRMLPQLALPDWDACARQLLGIYENVLSGAGRGSPVRDRGRPIGARSEPA